MRDRTEDKAGVELMTAGGRKVTILVYWGFIRNLHNGIFIHISEVTFHHSSI